VYERASAHGRMLPSGLHYLDSWVVDNEEPEMCFQLMETDDADLFQVWRNHWEDLVLFEVRPVITTSEAAARNQQLPGWNSRHPNLLRGTLPRLGLPRIDKQQTTRFPSRGPRLACSGNRHRSKENGHAMNQAGATGHSAHPIEAMVSWTSHERLRFLWYRLRLTISDMNFATRRMAELQMRLI